MDVLSDIKDWAGTEARDIVAGERNGIFQSLPFQGQPGTGALWTYYDAVPSSDVPAEFALTPRGRSVAIVAGILGGALLVGALSK